MSGLHLRLTIGSVHYSISIIGLLALTGVLWIVMASAVPSSTPHQQVVLMAIAAAAAYLAGSWLVDRIQAVSGDGGMPIGPVWLTMMGVVAVRRSGSAGDQHRLVFRAFASYGVAGVLFGLLAWLTRSSSGPIGAGLFTFAVISCLSSLIRLCAIRGLPGGAIAGLCLGILGEDDDVVEHASSVASYATALLFAFTGFLVLAQPGPWSGWGLAGIALGVDSLILTQWFNRRSRWMNAALHRPLAEVGHSRLPTISHAAPISELLSIFAVEGNRAMVVVVDDAGWPTGVIQLRQLKAAVHSPGGTHPDEVMVTISDVPHLSRETTVFEAASYLERTGQPALVIESGSEKPRVISLEELLRIVD